MKILFTGGGSGGHFFPILAVMRELRAAAEEKQILDLEFFYMAPTDFGASLMREEGATVVLIPTGKRRNYFSVLNFLDFFKTGVAIFRAWWNMYLILPDVVFSKGGYGAFPTVVAAMLFGIPLVMHDSDAVPGRVSLFSAKFARRIGIAFSYAFRFFPKEKTALIGVPIRKSVLGKRRDAKEGIGVFSDLPVIGVLGGSQGAEKLNNAILGVIKDLTDEFEVVHQTGTAHLETVQGEARIILEFAHKERYRPYGFLNEDQMRDFYNSADLVISRAGASDIFEIAAWGKPSIIIPLANSAQDHQRKNAYEYAAEGAAIVIEEGNLTPHILFAEIKKVLSDSAAMKKMGEAAARFSRIDAARVIADELLKLGLHERPFANRVSSQLEEKREEIEQSSRSES